MGTRRLRRDGRNLTDVTAGRRLRVGIALYGDLTYDSRVRREAATLASAGHQVTVVCLGSADGAGAGDLPEQVQVVVVQPTVTSILPGSADASLVGRPRRLRALSRRAGWIAGYARNLREWGRLAIARCGTMDVWHLNDLPALIAIAPALHRRALFVYDAHELFLETGKSLSLPKPARAILRLVEGRLIARASAVVTVNDGLGEVLMRRYRPRRLEVVHNCPSAWVPPSPRPDLIRAARGISPDAAVILYHGGLGAHRGVERLMEAILAPSLRDAHVVLMGDGELRDQYANAAEDARWRGRVHVLEPVPPASLLRWVASADVGAMPIEASTLNHYLASPNKLFECITAGVPVVASDFPIIRRVVFEDPVRPLGVLCDPASVASISTGLSSILHMRPEARQELGRRCLAAARERWNWEIEARRLLKLYADLSDHVTRNRTADHPGSGR